MNEKQRRIFMTVSGVLISGFSVGIFNLALFGMDPFQVFAHGIWRHTPMGYGTFYTIINLLMLIGIFFIDKSKIGLGTLINIFLLGYVVQFSSWMFNVLIPGPSLVIRSIALIIGIVIICFGSAMYFTGDMGVSTYDAVAFQEFLLHVLNHYPEGKIVIILDNARIHHAKLLTPFLRKHQKRIELV